VLGSLATLSLSANANPFSAEQLTAFFKLVVTIDRFMRPFFPLL